MNELLVGLRAAAEDTRLRILVLCSQTELSVSELTQILGQSQPRVSRHLKLMVDGGLLERFREGSWAYYRLAETEKIGELSRSLLKLIPEDDPCRIRDSKRLKIIQHEREIRAKKLLMKNTAGLAFLQNLYVDDISVEEAFRELLPDYTGWDHIDIGTGTGRILEIVSPMTNRAVGIDLSHEMLTIARSNLAKPGLANCRVQFGDMSQIALNQESFDVATFHLALHCANEPNHVIFETANLLRPGGRIIIIDFAPHREFKLIDEYAHRWLGFSDTQIINWCEAAGFKMETTTRLTGKALTICLWSAQLPGPSMVNPFAERQIVSSWY